MFEAFNAQTLHRTVTEASRTISYRCPFRGILASLDILVVAAVCQEALMRTRRVNSPGKKQFGALSVVLIDVTPYIFCLRVSLLFSSYTFFLHYLASYESNHNQKC
jgi:hypothetical protein